MAENKTLYGLIAILALCLVIVSSLYFIGPNALNDRSNCTISVSGSGIVNVEPDQVKIWLGVETQEADVTKALDENSLKMKSVISALKLLGISEDEIETTYFNIYPVRNYETKEAGIVGYRVNNEIIVKTGSLDKTGDIINAAINAGANKVNRIEFGLSEDRKSEWKETAIKEACEDARSKANAIASGLDLEIVRVVGVRESGVYVSPYQVRDFGYPIPTPTPASMLPPPIEPREVQVSATLDVVYECR